MMDRTARIGVVRHDGASATSRGSHASSASSKSSNFSHVPTGSTIADPASVEETDGRTYNGYRQGKYFIPNDGAEQERLDLQHQLWLTMLDGELTKAPVPRDHPITVLDIGTGTGIWAIQFAERYPLARVIGTDLSVIQPANIPPNCQFFREDTEEEPWLFEEPFDLIHLRAMCTCFHDAKGMVERVLRHLQPGGWVEYQVYFSTGADDERGTDGHQDACFAAIGADEASDRALDSNPTSFRHFLRRIVAGSAASGRDVMVTEKYKHWLVEAGFTDVTEVPMLVPVNPWPLNPKDRKAGWFCKEDMLDGTTALRKVIIASGIPENEVDVWLEGVRDNIRDSSVHTYFDWRCVYARKRNDYEALHPDPARVVE